MNTKHTARIALAIAPLIMVLAGCYTQVETTRDAQYYEEYDSSEADTTNGYSKEPNYYSDGGWYPDYRSGFSYYSPLYSYAFYSPWYNPWYHYSYCNSFYGYYPYYYGHGYSGAGYGARRDTRKFGYTRTNPMRRTTTIDGGYLYRSDPSDRTKASRVESAARSHVSRNSLRVAPRTSSRQSYTRSRSVSRNAPFISQRSNSRSYSRPPSFRPSRPSYSSPRSGGGGFGGGGRSSGGSRGGGSRGGHR